MKLLVQDFSGGMTDYIYKFDQRYAEIIDNLFITKNLGLQTRFGQSLVSNTYACVSSDPVGDPQRIKSIFSFGTEDIIVEVEDKLYFYNTTSGFTEITGYGSASLFYNHGAEDYMNYTTLNRQVAMTSTVDGVNFRPILMYENSGAYDAVSAGLPELATDPTVEPAPEAGSTVSYAYAFVYYFSYESNGSTFEKWGTPTFVQVTSTTAPSGANIYAIAGVPTLGNSASDLYKIGAGAGNIKTRVFRTIDGGKVFYDTGISINNGTATANDNVEDDDLQLNTLAYWEGEVAYNDSPPEAKFCTVAQDAVYYCNLLGYHNRIQQSKRFQPGSCPADFYVDVDEAITGCGTTRDYAIVFTANRVYRIEGFISDEGRGDLQKRIITDRVGCINFKSIIQTRQGIYFAGRDGWYFTDGFEATCISEQIDETYKTLINGATRINRMNGAYFPTERKLFYSCQIGANNDVLFVYDEIYNAWSTTSGQSGFVPTALGEINGTLYRGDEIGYLYLFDKDLYTDPKRDTSATPSDWGEEAILHSFKHIALNFGSYDTNKWVYKVSLQVKDDTGQHIAVYSYDDDSPTPSQLKPITSVGLLEWGESGFIWGSTGLIWGRSFVVSKTRRFPKGSLRTRFKQLFITNQADAVIQRSDDLGNAIVDATAKTITLDNATLAWDPKALNYSIRLADSVGGYNTELEITSRDSDTQLTVIDANNYLVDGSQEWELVGIKKGEVLNLQAISYSFSALSDKGGYYSSDEAQGND